MSNWIRTAPAVAHKIKCDGRGTLRVASLAMMFPSPEFQLGKKGTPYSYVVLRHFVASAVKAFILPPTGL